jgi:hypothetical protein
MNGITTLWGPPSLTSPALLPTDSLSEFIGAYDLAATILERGRELPVYENGGFAALRSRYPTLLPALVAAVGSERRRIRTVVEERVIRWVVTREPSLKSRAVVFALDMGSGSEGNEEGAYIDLAHDQSTFGGWSRKCKAEPPKHPMIPGLS